MPRFTRQRTTEMDQTNWTNDQKALYREWKDGMMWTHSNNTYRLFENYAQFKGMPLPPKEGGRRRSKRQSKKSRKLRR
jgi:hypothetical protein